MLKTVENTGLKSINEKTVKLDENFKELFKVVQDMQQELSDKIKEIDQKTIILDEKIRNINLLCDQIINS